MSGSEYRRVEIGGRPIGGDAVSGGNVRLWRRCRRRGLLCNLHRLDGSRLAVGGLWRPVGRGSLALPVRCGRGLARARSRRALLNRGNRLCRDGPNRLGRGYVRYGCGLARTEQLGVDVGGGAIAGEAVHGPLALTRRLSRGRVIRRRASGNDDRNRGQRGSGPDARQCAVQDVPHDSPAIKAGYGARKARIARWRGCGLPQNGEGSGAVHAGPLIDQHQPACKPGSVGPRPLSRPRRDGHSSGTMLAHGLEQPTRTASLTSLPRALSLSRTTRVAIPIRSCSRWGLPCRFRRRSRGALLPHLFTLTPLRSFRSCAGRFVLCGTFPRVAPPGVIRHRMSMEPGLSSPRAFRPEWERPSSRLTSKAWGLRRAPSSR